MQIATGPCVVLQILINVLFKLTFP